LLFGPFHSEKPSQKRKHGIYSNSRTYISIHYSYP